MAEGTNLENREARETLNQLEDYLARGYLLHGSKSKVEILEPRQARDEDPSRKVLNLNGVYAADDIRISVLMALFDKKDPTREDTSFFYHLWDKGEMKAGGVNATFTPGLIYVLPSEKFQKVQDNGDEDMVAFEPVVPVDIISVTPEILALIPGITYDMK